MSPNTDLITIFTGSYQTTTTEHGFVCKHYWAKLRPKINKYYMQTYAKTVIDNNTICYIIHVLLW